MQDMELFVPGSLLRKPTTVLVRNSLVSLPDYATDQEAITRARRSKSEGHLPILKENNNNLKNNTLTEHHNNGGEPEGEEEEHSSERHVEMELFVPGGLWRRAAKVKVCPSSCNNNDDNNIRNRRGTNDQGRQEQDQLARQQRLQQFQANLRPTLVAFQEQEIKLSRDAIPFHIDRARARYHCGNISGAMLSIRKVEQLQAQHERVVQVLDYLQDLATHALTQNNNNHPEEERNNNNNNKGEEEKHILGTKQPGHFRNEVITGEEEAQQVLVKKKKSNNHKDEGNEYSDDYDDDVDDDDSSEYDISWSEAELRVEEILSGAGDALDVSFSSMYDGVGGVISPTAGAAIPPPPSTTCTATSSSNGTNKKTSLAKEQEMVEQFLALQL